LIAVTSQAEARWHRRRRGSACCSTSSVASQRGHEPWANHTSITILVGGRYSSYAQYEDDTRANVHRWHIPEGNNFYWAAHDRYWRNCYGASSIGYNSDQYFSWYPDSAAPPDEDTIMKHAERLCSICKWLCNQGIVHIRLVGHSAGANICNFATHQIVKWLGNQFRFSQLILLSLPVPHPKGEDAVFQNYYKHAFPLVSQLEEKKFYNFRPRTDSVLSGVYKKREQYDYPDIRNNADPDIRAVPDAQREKVVPVIAGINHWEPCAIRTWDNEGLWGVIGCP
jgi:hypothetical protein